MAHVGAKRSSERCNYNGGKVLRIASLVSTLVVVGKKEREDNNQRVLIQQH